jgi:uncharacterized membrane protein YqjE
VLWASPDLVQSESFGSLLRGILADLRLLIREEVALARVELREQTGRAKAAAISLCVACGALAIGFVFLLVARAIAIADALNWPVWAGFLALAVVLCVAGLAAMRFGRQQLRRVHAVPTETMATLKENAEWIAKRLTYGRR